MTCLLQDGTEALFAAVKMNGAVFVEFLLQNGCQINGRDDKSATPLHVAVQMQHVECVKVHMSMYVCMRD